MKSSSQLMLFCSYIISLSIVETISTSNNITGVLGGLLFMGLSISLIDLWDCKRENEVMK